jgi:hypothetical protein
LVDLLGRPGANEDNVDRQKDEEKDWRDKKKCLDLQRLFPFKLFWFSDIDYRGKKTSPQPDNFQTTSDVVLYTPIVLCC